MNPNDRQFTRVTCRPCSGSGRVVNIRTHTTMMCPKCHGMGRHGYSTDKLWSRGDASAKLRKEMSAKNCDDTLETPIKQNVCRPSPKVHLSNSDLHDKNRGWDLLEKLLSDLGRQNIIDFSLEHWQK